jgi:hypothetical protein
MKDFAGSSMTYYGLAREKLVNKYPRLFSVLVILALICMTGLALFIISDLVSFASNPDHKGVSAGLDLKGPEKGMMPMTIGKEESENKSENISENSSRSLDNLSHQTKLNASLPSSQAAKGGVSASKSSSVIRHHSSSSSSSSSPSSSSSSSSSSSPAKSTKKSSDNSSLTNETAAMNNTQRSNDSEVAPTAILASLPSIAFGSIFNPTMDTPAREPATIINFKTKATSSKSGQSLKSSPVVNSRDATKKTNPQAIGTKSASSQKSKVAASSQAKRVQEARAKLKANRDRIAEKMKKKAALSRAKAASN